MRIVLFAIAMAAGAGSAGTALAQDASGLAPSSQWTVDYDADSCALRRWFGVGEDQAYLEFRRFAPGPGMQTVIASPRMEARKPPQFRYRFGDSGEWQEPDTRLTANLTNGFSGVVFEPRFMSSPEYDEIENSVERELYLRSADLKAAELRQAAAIDTITLRGAFRRDLTLRLERLDAPIGALQECVDELMTHWNIDVEAHKTLTRPAVPTNLSEVPSMMDYPPKMVRQRMPGLVNVRLSIDETGKIAGCSIQMPLSDPEFEESSCADIQHALEFDPALDKDGKPIASYWITKVRFILN